MKLKKCCKNCENFYYDKDCKYNVCEFDYEKRKKRDGKKCCNFTPNGADFMSAKQLAEYGIIRFPPIILSEG